MNGTHLFQDLSRHCEAAVEYNAEFPSSLHLLQEGPGVARVDGKLANFQPDIVPGGSCYQLLQTYETFNDKAEKLFLMCSKSHQIEFTNCQVLPTSSSFFSTDQYQLSNSHTSQITVTQVKLHRAKKKGHLAH